MTAKNPTMSKYSNKTLLLSILVFCDRSYQNMATLTPLQTIGQADTYKWVVVSVRQAIISAAHDRWGNLWLLMTAALLDHQVIRLRSTVTDKKAATCHHWSKLVFHLHNKTNKKIWAGRNSHMVHPHPHVQCINHNFFYTYCWRYNSPYFVAYPERTDVDRQP